MAQSTLKIAFEEIVKLSLIPQPNAETKVCSYKDDFDYLWNFEVNENNNLFNWLNQNKDKEQNIIIIWDGIPAENKDEKIAEYLTPFDWALASSYLLLKISEKTSYLPKLRIFIFDTASDKKNKKAFAFNAFQAIGPALPWVQFYRPLVEDYDSNLVISLQLIKHNNDESVRYFRSALPPGMLGAANLFEDLFTLNTTFSLRTAQEETDRKQTLKTLIEIWQSKLLAPENRHHIGNIIAPTLLSKGLPSKLQQRYFRETEKIFPLLNAVKSLVKVLELENQKVSGSVSSVSEEGFLKEFINDKRSIFDRRTNIKFLLVDDQYELGFNHILANILFGKNYQSDTKLIEKQQINHLSGNNGELFCEKNADSLFAILEQMSLVKKQDEPDLLRLPHSCDVLLLDLRLWTKEEERKIFFERLIDVFVKINHIDLLFNDSVYRSAYNEALKLKNKQGTKGNEIEAIAFFPLLLSYFDPSLPIILFSSTHQRKLTEMLSHRPNIITNFSKPIFNGYKEESANDLIENLKKALEKSVLLHESRVIWERICERDITGGYIFDWNSLPAFEFENNDIEVYNSSQTIFSRGKNPPYRINKGKMVPKLLDTNLRSRMAEIYFKYILEENFCDFFTVPYELIEANLVPDFILNNPVITNPNFNLRVESNNKKNSVMKVCQLLRNKKAHGNVNLFPNTEEKLDNRIVSIISFLCFLDFLEGANIPYVDFGAKLRNIENRLLRKPSLTSESSLRPSQINNNKDVDIIEYFAFLSCYSAENANDGTDTFLSSETATAIQELVNFVLSNP